MKRILIFVSLSVLVGCGAGKHVSEIRYTSVAALKELYAGYPKRITEDVMLLLWVGSSDRFGNFAGSLAAQDATGGIEIKADCNELFRYFPQRARITVRCQGLWLGESGGGLCLGAAPTYGFPTDYIPEERIPMHVKLFGDQAVTAPARITEIDALDASLIHTLAGFSHVQFIDEETAFSWGEEDVAVIRHIVNKRGDTLDVYVSARAEFADKPLPTGSGYIEGILNCYAGRYSLRPVWDRAAEMDNPRF